MGCPLTASDGGAIRSLLRTLPVCWRPRTRVDSALLGSVGCVRVRVSASRHRSVRKTMSLCCGFIPHPRLGAQFRPGTVTSCSPTLYLSMHGSPEDSTDVLGPMAAFSHCSTANRNRPLATGSASHGVSQSSTGRENNTRARVKKQRTNRQPF
ncbi:hypothetical protein AAFF_G00304600 [Aldrovandia affinis]|uniref:Uncharacterized protein n=1 Tax=Aldrovandia affinis TaxID=143900 RepID=A0AAD7WS12_9TELE|nr:hypothetical protein AAFF_G00304600 [Aldrovandia affinis]